MTDAFDISRQAAWEMTDPVRIAAQAIWEDRYPHEDWETARWLAEETPDGGNARYISIMGHARAAVEALRKAGAIA